MSALDVFGNIEFVRSHRARHISVKILSDGLRVSLPHKVSESEARRFIMNERERILSKQNKVKARAIPTLLRDDTPLRTRTFTVTIVRAQRKDVYFLLKDGILKVELPADAEIESEEVQQSCWNGINYFLKKEAKKILPERVKELAATHAFEYKQVKIQSSKTRWGSCSREKNINLSFYLLLLPAHLCDYVILHELCHTRELNHGDKFWGWMDKVTEGETNKLRREMKQYHIPAY